jgi:hypothetical protein
MMNALCLFVCLFVSIKFSFVLWGRLGKQRVERFMGFSLFGFEDAEDVQ